MKKPVKNKEPIGKLLTRSAFAKLAGVSVQYVRRIIKSGELPARKAGIDLEHVEVQAWLGRKKDQGKAIPSISGVDSEDVKLPKSVLERYRLLQQIKSEELDTALRRDRLISREVVQDFLNKLFAIENNELMRIADRLAPELASVAGVSDSKKVAKINAAIEKDVAKVMERIRDLFVGYLAKIKTGG